MSALTKAKLAEVLSTKIGLNKSEAKRFVETFFNKLVELISSGHPVKLSGFGRFDLRDKSKRPGRNPKTGEFVEIDERRVVIFHAGQKLKNTIEEVSDKE